MQSLAEAVRSVGAEPVREPEEAAAPEPVAAGAEPPPTDLAARLEAAGAQHAVALTLWRAGDGAVSGVAVSVTTPDGARYRQGAELAADGQLAAAVAEATAGAYARLRRGPGPWLELEGSPAGAVISVDGQAAGALPRRVKVAGGLHHLEVESPGYTPFDETITVPRNLDALKRVRVALEPLPVASVPPVGLPPSAASPSAWNYVLGGLAVGVGVLLAIGPVRSAVDDGECGRTEAGRCTGVVRFDGLEAVKLVAGAVLVVGGVAFVVVAPLEGDGGQVSALALAGDFE